jgi:hypothetical protein
MEPAERRFLERFAADLEVGRETAATILSAMLVKNSA